MTTRMLYSLMVLALVAGSVVAQEAPDSAVTGWTNSLVADLTVTQAAYSDSWTGGEAGSVNWVGNLNGSAERQLNPSWHFRSVLRLSFGQTMTQDAVDKEWSKPQKSTDLIDWENVARLTKGWEADPYAAFRLESQFFDGANDSKKLYFSPIKLTESVGFSRHLYRQDKDFVMSRLGVAMRQFFLRSADADLAVFDTTVVDGGLESVTDVELHFNGKLSYVGKLSLFKAFYNSREDDLAGTPYEDDWKAVDVNWENTIHAAITKIVTVRFYTQLLYDKEISKKGRLKETLGLGLILKLI